MRNKKKLKQRPNNTLYIRRKLDKETDMMPQTKNNRTDSPNGDHDVYTENVKRKR